MNARSDDYALLAQIGELIEGTLSREASAALQQTLSESAPARALYLRAMALEIGLEWTKKERSPLNLTSAASECELPNAPLRLAATKAWSWRSPRFIGIAASISLVCYFVALAGLLVWDRFHRPLLREMVAKATSEPMVAALRSAHNCRWKAGSAAPSLDESFSSRNLQLQAGLAELEFVDGARVVVEGPAEFEVRSPKEGFLRRGKLVAHVPPQAIGFTVETPTATVIDLGTEFGLHVSDEGETQVQMLSGSAQVKLAQATGKAGTGQPKSYKLSAGDAIRVRPAEEATSAVGEFIKPQPEQIAAWKALRQQVHSGSEPKLKLVSGGKPVTASSVYDGGPNYPLTFLPSAVTDGRFNDTPDSWWITADKVPQSHLIVDLEAAYTIAEIRLQNTHHGQWGDRATTDFRLSVSMNGQDFFTVADGILASVKGIESPPFEQFPVRPVVRARYVKFEALRFYGLSAGLNELQVFAVDEEDVGQDSNAPPPAKQTDDAVNAAQHKD